MNLKSIPFLTVHDSVAVDTFPGEEKVVAETLAKAFLDVKQELLRRYHYQLTMPLEVEVKQGPNWLEGKCVLKKEHEYNVKPVVKQEVKQEFYNDPIPF